MYLHELTDCFIISVRSPGRSPMLFLWGGARGLGGGRRPVGGARQSRPTLHVPHPQQGQGVRVPRSPNLNTPRFSAGWYTAFI